jgi:MoaA/NifB/PqqE/SkfB family radical SAM enzyme/Sec-independent protein translocase protein TatA
MFGIGFGELLLFGIIIFFLFPSKIPVAFRELGKLLGKFKQFKNELMEEIKIDDNTRAQSRVAKEVRIKKSETTKVENIQDESAKQALNDLREMDRNWNSWSTEKIVPYLFDKNESVKQEAYRLLLIDPLFAFRGRKTLSADDYAGAFGRCPAQSETLVRYFRPERIKTFSRIIEQIPDEQFEDTLIHMALLPGIQNLDIDAIFSGSKQQYRQRLEQYIKDNIKTTFPSQLTVVPTFQCNMNCSYCFNREAISENAPIMNIDLYKTILKNLRAEGTKVVNLFGGEPSIVPDIDRYVQEIIASDMQYYFATNGTVELDTFKKLITPKALQSVTFHIQEDNEYSPSQIANLMENVRYVNEQRIPIILRYNLHEQTTENWQFFEKYFRQLNEFVLSFAVAFPSPNKSNMYVPLHSLKQYTKKILSLIAYVMDSVNINSVQLVFAKPFPLCLFNEDELQVIMRYTTIKNVCELDQNNYRNNCTVNPDLSYNPCMALVSKDFTFPGFTDFSSVDPEYIRKTEAMTKKPLLDVCVSCPLHATGLCQAACYAYAIHSDET